ncbi:MAG: TonB family protein [Terracidiphilus sp.]
MFEDSTFESNGRIRTRSRAWMLAALGLNSGILLALILIPLLYPEALPRIGLPLLMEAPPAPAVEKPQPQHVERVFHGAPELQGTRIFAPPTIPTHILQVDTPETAITQSVATLGSGPGGEADASVFATHRSQPNVRVEPEHAVRVAGSVEAGLLLRRTMPVYPALARAMHAEGTVVLAATISKQGTIENLHVVGGPAVLQQAALDAVRTWLYRPFLLDGQPVEVETTVNVIFTMSH